MSMLRGAILRMPVLILACLAGASYATRETESRHQLQALAALLSAPNSASAFNPSHVGNHLLSRHDSTRSAAVDGPKRLGHHGPMMRLDVKTMPGVSAPFGFFDPLDFCKEASEAKIRFYREVEIKHGRLSMLAAPGFLVGEQFHPMFNGEVTVPSYKAFQETPLNDNLELCLALVGIHELFSIFTFNSPFGGEWFSIRTDYEPGNLGFDPLGLRPKDKKEWKDMQTKEINNGRLAMIAIIGMIGQELVTDSKLF